MRALLAAVLLVPAPLWAAIDYARFTQPRGEYAFEYPADWQRTYGIETVMVHPPGREAAAARMAVEGYPIDKTSPRDAQAFAARLLAEAKGLKKVERDSAVRVDGRAARRIELVETVRLHGRYRQALQGPLREVYVIVPQGRHYLVIRASGLGKAYADALPEFEHLLATLKLNG